MMKILVNLVWMMIMLLSDYTQLVTPGTYVISDSESNDGSDKQEENINLALGGVSNKFVWQNIG
jgi:hypothetical protein